MCSGRVAAAGKRKRQAALLVLTNQELPTYLTHRSKAVAMAPPLRVGDLPKNVQNEIIAGTLRNEIAEFEHQQGIRPRPASA